MLQAEAADEQTHAAFNSASRTRSARAPISELNQTGPGSPSRRNRGQTVEVLSPRKPDIREVAAPARFGGLHNGFAASPQLRQTTQRRQPTTSPRAVTRNDEVEPAPGSPRMDDHNALLGHDDATDWDEHSQVRTLQRSSLLTASSSIMSSIIVEQSGRPRTVGPNHCLIVFFDISLTRCRRNIPRHQPVCSRQHPT
jgi:hypothetical protein